MQTTESRPVRARGTEPDPRLPWTAAAVSAGLCLAAALLPGEWSLVDDPGLKTLLSDNVDAHGLVGGIARTVADHASEDTHWGLFRPVYYLYASTFYLMSPALAHAVRMGMFLLAVLVPAVQAARRGHRWELPVLVWAVAALLANSHLYQGLSFLSLQELTGIALVATGLMVRAPFLRGLFFLAAALTKAPFVWLELAWAAHLLVRKQTRPRGAVLAAGGVATLVLAALAARAGTYTSAYTLSLQQFETTLRQGLPLFGWPAIVCLIGLLALRVDVRRLGWRDSDAWVFLIGGLGYLATMLPWGLQAYYGAPAVWMLTVAGIRLLARADRAAVPLRRPLTAVALVLALGIAGRMVAIMGGMQYDRNASVVGVRNWALTLPSRGVAVGINGPEAAVRLDQIIRMHRPGWRNQIVNIDDTDTVSEVDYYVALVDQGPGNPRLTVEPVRVLPRATVYHPDNAR